MSAATHVTCRICGHWEGNVNDVGIPIGWTELYDRDALDPARKLVGWVDYHICSDGRRVRLMIPAEKPLPAGTVRLAPRPIT